MISFHVSPYTHMPTLAALGRWVTSQRYDKKMGKLTNSNERRLKRIGFTWNRYEQS